MKGELQCDPITLIQHISYCQEVGSNPKPPMNQTTLLEAAQVPPQEVPGNAVQAVSSSILAFRNSPQAVPTFSLKGKGARGITWYRNAAATINNFPFVFPINKHFRIRLFCLG